ncbi:PTS glucose transporter subunit IIA [Nanchangia anserum]|uniref:PTS glucose transporter subunit IIA n=1 Tax=Nanchangia anserum TaxID=2692125 RepID=A0A8I0G9M1_9ACTO|nr:glucose PTS transporter subunit IIA [Nanchangia anserum]MBD3689699.1 PTS glucose transporter subunit IIA [Nanchangia anserum]QOX81874.1 PTS glucose transporter subunit IIA [Nanchangia anserum]
MSDADVILAPLSGTIHPLSDVPDPVFARGMVGPGLAIAPTGEGDVDAVAPLSGTIAKIHPHAFIVCASGVNVLVHLGLDTVKLDGEGFTVHAATGDEVEAGQPLITWNPRDIEARGLSAICPVIFMETIAAIEHLVGDGEQVSGGAPLARATR